jgi:hypothetical protein
VFADELRRQSDNFVVLEVLREVVGRPPRGGAAAAPVSADGDE